ncbi:hypothetical protein [Nocardia brasiliensis]|uniref:hypothetical protein n=1 Tax=Nocardia brasiliensis TaxID=37326 RepID=UPI0024584616|nr:hypothetical protein [Nocardia brasiliensis]
MTDAEAAPGSIRPGGRTARVRESVLQVARALLAERGIAQLDQAGLAAAAAVRKPTL